MPVTFNQIKKQPRRNVVPPEQIKASVANILTAHFTGADESNVTTAVQLVEDAAAEAVALIQNR